MSNQDDQTEPDILAEAETALGALRRHEVDAVVGDNHVLLLRLHEAEKDLRESEERLRQLNKTLEQRVAERTAELEQQTQQLRNLAHQLTNAEQREHKRLANILHDGLQQLLIAAEMNLEMLATDGMDDGPEKVEQARQLVREAIQASRSLAYELAPPGLDEISFGKALDWLARWFGEKHHFKVEVHVADDTPILPETIMVFSFNAVRELLLNSVKHSEVQEAVVHYTGADGTWCQIEVKDAGKGFEPANFYDTGTIEKGLGLLSIRERLIALGGSLEITSEPGAGANFVIRIPISD